MSWLQNLLLKANQNGLVSAPNRFQNLSQEGANADPDQQLAMPRPQVINARDGGGSFSVKQGPYGNVRRNTRSTSAEELDQQMMEAGQNFDIHTFTTPPLGLSNEPPPVTRSTIQDDVSSSLPPGSPMNPMSGNVGVTSSSGYSGSAYNGNNLGLLLSQRRAMLQSNPQMYFNDYSLFDYGNWMDYNTFGMGMGGFGGVIGTTVGVELAADAIGGAVDLISNLFGGSGSL